MAHVGQQYVVAFRRDLASNVNSYRFAFAQVYSFQWATAANFIPWFPNQPPKWYSNSLVYADAQLATWSWPAFDSGHGHVSMKFFLPTPWTPTNHRFLVAQILVDGTVRFERVDNASVYTSYATWGDRFEITTTINTLSDVGLQPPPQLGVRAQFRTTG